MIKKNQKKPIEKEELFELSFEGKMKKMVLNMKGKYLSSERDYDRYIAEGTEIGGLQYAGSPYGGWEQRVAGDYIINHSKLPKDKIRLYVRALTKAQITIDLINNLRNSQFYKIPKVKNLYPENIPRIPGATYNDGHRIQISRNCTRQDFIKKIEERIKESKDLEEIETLEMMLEEDKNTSYNEERDLTEKEWEKYKEEHLNPEKN